MNQKSFHFRFPSHVEYREVLERDVLHGRLLVPYRGEPLELYDRLALRLFVGDRPVDLDATVVAPRVSRGRRNYVGLSLRLSEEDITALRALAQAEVAEGKDSASHLFKDEDSQDLDVLRADLEQTLFGDEPQPASTTGRRARQADQASGTTARNPDPVPPPQPAPPQPAPPRPATPQSSPKPRHQVPPTTDAYRQVEQQANRDQGWTKKAVAPRLAPDAYFPHVLMTANRKPTGATQHLQWPALLPTADRIAAAREGTLDNDGRNTLLAELDRFDRIALDQTPGALLGLPDGADEEVIHRAFTHLTEVLGARNPMQTLDLELARLIELVFEHLIRARDVAIARLSRQNAGFRREPTAVRPASKDLRHTPAEPPPAVSTPNRERVGESAAGTRFGAALAFGDEDSGPVGDR